MRHRDATPLPVWKKGLFSLIVLVTVLAGLEGALALIGFQPLSLEADPYVGFSSQMPHFVVAKREDGTDQVTTAPSKLRWLNRQSFPLKKPSGTFRIFCVGGSTTYGRPFFDHTSFPGWMRALLPAIDGSKRWEVINAGGISYASYRVARVVEELCRFEPDLLVVYVGQNEFLERRTYEGLFRTPSLVTQLGGLVRHTRTAALLQSGMRRLGAGTSGRHARRTVLGEQVDAIPIDAVGPEAYTRDDTFKRQVVAHLRINLHRMIAMARRAGAEVVLVTPASNLADFAPFKSQHRDGLSAQELAAWQTLDTAARQRMDAAQWHEARRALEQAAAIDPRHAGLQFRLGTTLTHVGAFDAAREHFQRAIEEDICPLRAIAAVVDAIRDVASQRGVPLVDFAARLAQQAEHHLPGDAFFHDHVHPRIAANRDLALQILRTLADAGVVPPAETWREPSIRAAIASLEGGIDRPAHAAELFKLSEMLQWLGHHRQARRTAAEAVALADRSAEALCRLGGLVARQGDREAAIGFFRQAIERQPDFAPAHLQIGLAYFQSGDAEQAAAALRRALKLQDDLAPAHAALGMLLSRQGKLEEALEHFSRAVQLEPDSHTAHNNVGLALAHLGRYREAIAHYRRAIALNRDNSSAHWNLGMALEAIGQPQAAMACYRQVLRLRPDHRGARDRLERLEAGAG